MDIDDRKALYSKHPLPGMHDSDEPDERGHVDPAEAATVYSSHSSSFVLTDDE
jgi:hypothetical protein